MSKVTICANQKGGMAILVHFFGTWDIFGVPAGFIIAMNSKR